MQTKKKSEWQEDEIMAEIHRVREKLGNELRRDPKGFYKRMAENAKKAGVKYSDRKPSSFSVKKRHR